MAKKKITTPKPEPQQQGPQVGDVVKYHGRNCRIIEITPEGYTLDRLPDGNHEKFISVPKNHITL